MSPSEWETTWRRVSRETRERMAGGLTQAHVSRLVALASNPTLTPAESELVAQVAAAISRILGASAR